MCSPRALLCLPTILVLLFWNGCSGRSDPPVRTYGMGDRVELGHLIYTIYETRWLTEIGEGAGARVTQNRFFLIRMTVGSSSSSESLIPDMSIEDDRGTSYPELSNGDGIPQFVGALHPVTLANPVVGYALFDAPPGHYKLHLSDEDGQRQAVVDIPLSFRSESPEVPSPGAEPK